MNHHDFVNEITAMLRRAEPPITADCCIYRVPYDIRRLNEDVFTPKVVSIGPFHHHALPRLHNMEKYKLVYLKRFSERDGVNLDTLITSVEEAEPSVRRCYSETIDLSMEQLVKVILVDSCFLFELFWRSFYDEWTDDDNVHLKPWLTTTMRLDLLLLENQLPFFVLERLYNLAFASSMSNNSKHPSFLELTFDYFVYYNRLDLNPRDVSNSICHFTDLIRTFHLQPSNRRPRKFYMPPFEELPERQDSLLKHLHSASELLEAGLKFKVSSKKCLLDLQFEKGVLEMPCFEVYNRTEIFVRNVMALEQCHYPSGTYVTDYIFLLDFLINTHKDVDVLVQKGILVNWLGDSDAVATMVNGLCTNLTQTNMNSNYRRLCDDLNAFYNDRWHRRKATLRHDYFRTPWMTASSIAAILLLFLTLVQTICSIISLLK
ncbi:UPF0481 protein [Senna tora]|uniref:UPF0481 protein n=1 Tax=Senna tora TaxID=362788 RepID=A0A834WFB2_9FABA|nr:UPF0481 protein [Senna tora]